MFDRHTAMLRQVYVAERTAARHWLVFFLALLACACSRAPTTDAVEPVTVGTADAAVGVGESDAKASADVDAGDATDAAAPVANVGGGLWVVDAAGLPIGVVVGRGHPSLSAAGTLDVLRDGVVVYSPKAGVFVSLQMSTGKVIAPRIGVSDTTCTGVAVAGYYAGGDEPISGQAYAFVYQNQWYRIAAYQPAQLVTCGGTVPDGVDGKCAPHAGTCRGFPVETFAPPLPTVFPAPMAFSWLAK